jgi:hypothetical protein
MEPKRENVPQKHILSRGTLSDHKYPPNSECDFLVNPIKKENKLKRIFMQKATCKKVKMQYLHRPSAKSWNGYRRVPFLRISGNWLEQVGFSIGSIVEIITSENQLIIRKENE